MEKNRFDVKDAELLDMPERKKLLPAERLLSLIPIDKSYNILDIGAGTGYFSIPAAKITEGIVYALDVENQLLKKLKDRAEQENIDNIRLIEGQMENITLSDNSVELVIASLVLHYAESLSEILKEIKRVLKHDGYILCFEWDKKESPIGPSLDKRIASADMEKELEKEGLIITGRVFPTEYLYIFVVRKS